MERSRFLLFLCFFLGHVYLFAEREELFIPREDGTIIQGYLDRPDDEMSFPLVVFVDGSFDHTVKTNHEKLAAQLGPHKIGLLSLEKRGITAKGMNRKEFIAHDCFEERIHDYFLLLHYMNEGKISGYNGRCVLLGGSEGGKIVPRLSLISPFTVQGIILVGSAGGLPFAEEMKYQFQQLTSITPVHRLGSKIRSVLFPNEIDEVFEKMLKHPESLEIYASKTWKWFASYLRYDLLVDLLKVKVPIYMIHGEKDIRVPIKSADLVKKSFDKAGKTNLHYARYRNLGHAMTGRKDVYAPMIAWIRDKSF